MSEATQPIEHADQDPIVRVHSSSCVKWIGKDVSLSEFVPDIPVVVRVERVTRGPNAGDLVFSYRAGHKLRRRIYIQGREVGVAGRGR